MKPTLTIDDVVKLTSLSRSTVQVYASQRKIGTKIGAKRFFTKEDVKKLSGPGPKKTVGGTRKRPAVVAGRKVAAKKAAAKRPKAASRSPRAAGKQAAPRPAMQDKAAPAVSLPVQRRSFLSFLGFGRKTASNTEKQGK